MSEPGAIRKKVFLATTALEDFWDPSYPVVFLGKWCKRYSRKKFWENISSETMASFFKENKVNKTYLYLNTVFERLLFVLHKQMNQVHGTDFSIRYWRIILSSWLLNYVHVMYDRYINLKNFIGLYPDFTSICLNKECFIIPKDSLYYTLLTNNDDYNLQIYSNILFWLGYKLPAKRLTIAIPHLGIYLKAERRSYKKILKFAYELVCKTFQNKHQVFLRNTYFSYSALFKLILKTKGAVWPCIYGYEDLPDFSIDQEARGILGSFDFGENEFEKILASFIHFDMPQSMIEGFNYLKKRVSDDFISEPKAIMSGISWWYDNSFRIWAAESAEKGTLLLGVQHGAGYGVFKNLFAESVELGIVDRFYSWGWNFHDFHTKIIPMPATKLVGVKKAKIRPNNEILYASTIIPRYLSWFPWSIDYWEKYFLNQTLFLSSLSESTLSQLRFRPHREDLGWDAQDRIRDSFPQLKIESWDIPISKSLSNCSGFICDTPLQSTIFVEALMNNKPTVAFYNPNFTANPIKDEAMDILSQLKENSIVFEDPLTAAKQLNSVYGSIESWWNEPKRQEVVRNFLYKFGRTSSTWLKDWSEEISNVIKTKSIKR